MADRMSAEGWGIAILIAFETPNLFSGLLPSLFTISTFSGAEPEKQKHTKKMIRKGEIQAGVVSLGLGLGGSVITRTPWPLLLTIGMMVWLIWNYEAALKTGCTTGPKMSMDQQDSDNTYAPVRGAGTAYS